MNEARRKSAGGEVDLVIDQNKSGCETFMSAGTSTKLISKSNKQYYTVVCTLYRKMELWLVERIYRLIR